MSLGVYVHFPYCRSKCPYCDFAVHVVREIPHVAYADAVLQELSLRAEAFAGLGPLRSVFFGGGTPSLWDPRQIERVLRAVGDRFPARLPLEVTVECNPDDLDSQGFANLRAAGVTRASIGVQSFDGAVLRGLGRRHDGLTAERAIAAALGAGFASVAVDLIHGGVGHTPSLAARDASLAVQSGVQHVSNYGLTLDELAVDVPLSKWVREGRVQVPDADGQADLGQAARAALVAGGLERYEISNFARPGAMSRHNLGYWAGEPYLGLGVGAYGATPVERYGNPRGVAAYLGPLTQGTLPIGERDPLTVDARFRERVFLGLRLVRGLSLGALALEFGDAAVARLRASAGPFVRMGMVVLEADALRLTEAGLDLHSELAVRLL